MNKFKYSMKKYYSNQIPLPKNSISKLRIILAKLNVLKKDGN